ncbi:transposable element Tc1 transposase [Trichonephila clavipes]|nr:transposable element Tc1 transposase [Trichonephila clavipes]
MGNVADLSDFDRGQIVMARRLGTSISETARLVGCSRSTVVSTYAKWMNDGETSSRRHGVGRLHAIKEKSHWRLSRMVKQNRSQTVAQSTAQYNAIPSRIVLEHTAQRTLLATSHSCAFADQLRLHWAREHRDQWERVAWSDESRFVIHYADGHIRIRCLPGEQLLPRGIEHDAEFQLMSWLPNLPDLNLIEHIWEVMGQQLRVQRPPIHNISDLRDRCLNIWYNVSPPIYQGLVASMPRRVEAVLRAKCGSTRY